MASYRILVIEEDPSIRKLIQRTLVNAGHRIRYADWAALPDDAVSPDHDALLIDLMAADARPDLIAAIKQRTDTPVVVLSTREGAALRAIALDYGADDFLQLPLDTEDLVTRVRVALRRWLTREGGITRCQAGNVCIDLLDRSVTKGGWPVHLTRKEFMLLARLSRFPGRWIPHDQMISGLWARRRKNSIAYLRTLLASALVV